MEKIEQEVIAANHQNDYFRDVYTGTIFTGLELSKIELLKGEAIYIESSDADYYDYDLVIE